MSDRNSQYIDDIDATRISKLNPLRKGGVLREDVATITTTGADSIGDVYRFVRLPSRARVVDLLISHDDMGDTGDADVGIYLANGGAVEDVDLFASDFDLNAAAQVQAGAMVNIAPEDMGKALWELAGESEDPNVDYDVALTLTEATTAAGDITLQVRYLLAE